MYTTANNGQDAQFKCPIFSLLYLLFDERTASTSGTLMSSYWTGRQTGGNAFGGAVNNFKNKFITTMVIRPLDDPT